MAAFLLSWNPDRYAWDALRSDISRIRKKGYVNGRWSCGNRTDMPKGSEFFMIRLGPAPKGIVGRGITRSEPFEGAHWDPERKRQKIKALYVDVRFTDLSETPVISWEELERPPLSRFKWSIFASGVALPEVIVDELDRRWDDGKKAAASIITGSSEHNASVQPGTPGPRVFRDLTSQRKDPEGARAVFDVIFDGVGQPQRRLWEGFLADSIEYANVSFSDRWVVALHRNYLRFNVGMLLCIQFHPEYGVTVLLDKKLRPKGLEILDRQHRNSPGCQHAIVPFAQAEKWLNKITEASKAAISICGHGHRGPGSFRGAHSPGVLRYLEQVLGRSLPNPSYAVDAFNEASALGDHPYSDELAADREILEDATLSATEKEAVIQARRGQGLFRQRVLDLESRCRVTAVDNAEHLRASHIKPWKDSTNTERLSGDNGLMLAPHVDHLFDQGFISFTDFGDLLVSPKCPEAVLAAWGIPKDLNVGPFRVGQRPFLAYHRANRLRP